MSEKANKKNTAPKKAASKDADSMQMKSEVLETNFKCIVLAQPNGKPVTLGSMVCGAKARAILPESKAKAAEKAGYIEILGIA